MDVVMNEAAKLECVDYDTIRKRIQNGNLKAIKVKTNTKRGFEYRIALENLSPQAQKRYAAQQKRLAKAKEEKILTVESLNEQQKADIVFWKNVLNKWNTYVSKFPKQKTEATKDFVNSWNMVNDRKISERSLHRKEKIQKELGDVGLADLRHQSYKKGQSKLDGEVWEAFKAYYLNQGKPGIATICELLTNYYKIENPELLPLPSTTTFARKVKQIPDCIIKYYREGDRAYKEDCLPYLIRDYERIESNEVWSSDYHTLDFFVKDDVTGEVFRPHLNVWFDTRSRKILSCTLRKSADSDGVVIAFRKAVEKWGLPQSVYLDNGREFLTSDFGGRGRRKTDDKSDYGMTILERCGVVMHNARVAHGQSKAVERCFKTTKKMFSNFFKTYTGGRPEERPEQLGDVLKKDKEIPLLSEVRTEVELFFEGYYNERPSEAEGLHGKCPNDCYAENLFKKRTATQEQLNLMLLRTEKLQKIKENGVFVKVGKKEIYFYNESFVTFEPNKKVYVRYNPENLESVRVYDENDVFLLEAKRWVTGGFDFGLGSDTESIKEVERAAKVITEFAKKYKGNTNVPTAREVIKMTAESNVLKNASRDYRTKVIELAISEEKTFEDMDKAVGGDEVMIDFAEMTKNLSLLEE